MNELIIEGLKPALHMFLFLGAELSVLYLVISYIIGILQAYIPPEKIQSILSEKKGKGYIISALLGAITPFCSCSTIPFLKGLLKARAGFGPMMVFLFASPLLNPIVIGLLIVTFGLKIAIYYFSVALLVSIVGGYLLKKLGFQKYIKDTGYKSDPSSLEQKQEPKSSCGSSCGSDNKEEKPSCSSSCGSDNKEETPSCGSSCSEQPQSKVRLRWGDIWQHTWKDFKKVLPYLLAGITIGSIIYGFIPENFIIKWAGNDSVFSIPISAIIGVPLYIRASAVIPLSAALMAKGMNIGAVMALIIGSAGASLTEVILLKSMFKTPLIIAFLVVIFGMAIIAGYGLFFGFV